MNDLKFGLSQLSNHAPVWMVNTAAVLAVLIVAKHQLITDMPIANDIIKDRIAVWVDYVLDFAQVVLAVTIIFFGEKEEGNDNTRG